MMAKLPSPKRARLENKTSSPKSPSHETALFLNNVGIQFLLQDCYSQAVETFQDAYMLVRKISLGYTISVDGLQMIMRRALRNIAHPLCEESSPLALDVLETRNDDDTLILYNDNCDDVLQHVLETVPSSCVAFAIRMREQPTRFLREQVAIVEHNLAIAYFCQGKVSSTSSSSLQEALHYSESAALTFLDLRQTSSSDTRLMSLTMATLNSYLHLLQENGKEDKILQCYEILGQCRDAACETMEQSDHSQYSS